MITEKILLRTASFLVAFVGGVFLGELGVTPWQVLIVVMVWGLSRHLWNIA